MVNSIKKRHCSIKYGNKKNKRNRDVLDDLFWTNLGKPITGVYLNYGEGALTLEDVHRDERDWLRRKKKERNERGYV